MKKISEQYSKGRGLPNFDPNGMKAAGAQVTGYEIDFSWLHKDEDSFSKGKE